MGSNVSHNLGDPKMIGNVNEADIEVNGAKTRALLDTESCVSVIAQAFVDQHLKEISVKAIGELLNIECADGSQLPYHGYIEADVQVISGLHGSSSKPCIPLVVLDTPYSKETPVILGTNILHDFLSECKEHFGEQFLQKADLFTPWYLCFRPMVITDRELKRNKNTIAFIRCAEQQKITLKPNQSVTIKGCSDKELNYPTTTAIMQESPASGIPDYIHVTPAVIRFENGRRNEVTVNLSNLTANTVTIAPKTIICELQPVVFENLAEDEPGADITDELSLDENSLLSEEEKVKLKNLLLTHMNVFSKDEDIGHCELIKHRIDLCPGKETPIQTETQAHPTYDD